MITPGKAGYSLLESLALLKWYFLGPPLQRRPWERDCATSGPLFRRDGGRSTPAGG
jgi:hypothetical protein